MNVNISDILAYFNIEISLNQRTKPQACVLVFQADNRTCINIIPPKPIVNISSQVDRCLVGWHLLVNPYSVEALRVPFDFGSIFS